MTTTQAAGILFLTDDKQALFLKRGPGGDYPGYWCFPGGHVEDGETVEQAAEREAIEELGTLPAGTRVVLTRRISSPEDQSPAVSNPPVLPTVITTDFTTFLQRVKDQFAPTINGEHTGYAWASVDTPPEPLHPGCRIAIDRLTMDELGVARAMAAGDLTSPQRYQNVSLFDIRITGTGRAYRRSLDEHVWRDPSIYLNDEFLARCNGLPVIWEHPKKATLTSEEFANRIVGTILFPYIKGDEVWGIAKIYDEEVIKELLKGDLSTSPAVVLRDVESSSITLADGSTILVEGRPTLLDHIAICSLGVWDKGNEPTGVRTDGTTSTRELVRTDSEENRMADDTNEDKKAREDAAKADADAGQKLDKLLTHLDSMGSRFDRMEKRLDAMDEKDEKTKADAAKADAARRDAEREEWMKADAEQCAKDDAEEAAEAKDLEEKGEAREVAADKARKGRKDRMDARRRDAEEKEAEDKKKADAARSDAQGEVDLDKRIADAVRLHTKQDTPEERDAKSEAQARADSVYREFGDSAGAPPPMTGETAMAFRRRLLRGMQKHSKDWAGIDLHKLDDATLPIAERRIYADAQQAARNPTDLPDDRLITVSMRDPVTGLTRLEFRGKHTFIHGLRRPSARVTGVRTGRD